MLVHVLFSDTKPRPFSLGRLVQVLTWSRFSHVAIEQHDVVLDPWMEEVLYFNLDDYLRVPRVVVQVAVDNYMDLMIDTKPKPLLPTFARALTFGMARSFDCVSIVSDCLRQGGVNVPGHLYSPAQLWRWLVHREGYDSWLSNRPSNPTSSSPR